MSSHRPPTMRGRGRAKYRDQNSPSPTPGYQQIKGQGDGRASPDSFSSHRYSQPYEAKEHSSPSEQFQSDSPMRQSHTTASTEGAERESPSQVRPRKPERSKNRRPDVQVYVPRSRRAQAQPEPTAGTTGSSPNRSLASATSKSQQKVKPDRGIYVPKPMQHVQKLDQQPHDQHTSINSPPLSHMDEYSNDRHTSISRPPTSQREYSNDCSYEQEPFRRTSTDSAATSETLTEPCGNKKLKVHDRRKHYDNELEDNVESSLSSKYSAEHKSELTTGVEQVVSDVSDNTSVTQDNACNTTSTSHDSSQNDVMSQVISDNCSTEKDSDRGPSQEEESPGKRLCEVLVPEDAHMTDITNDTAATDSCYTCDKSLAEDSSKEMKDCNNKTLMDECETEVIKDSLETLPPETKEYTDLRVDVGDSAWDENKGTCNNSHSESKNDWMEETNCDSFASVAEITSEQDSVTAVEGKYNEMETDTAGQASEYKASDMETNSAGRALEDRANVNDTDSVGLALEDKVSDICDTSQDGGIPRSDQSTTFASDLNTTGNERISNTDIHDDQFGMDSQDEDHSVEQGETAVQKSGEYSNTAPSSETRVSSVDQSVSETNTGHQSKPEEVEEPDEDSWDAMFNDDGDCLDPSAMEELTRTVGKVEIQKSKKINYLDYQPKDKGNFDFSQYAHIIEIYDFPKEFVTRDLITAFQAFMSRGFDLKWVDDTHALGIFTSKIAAQDALDLHHPLVKVCPLSQASKQSRDKARRCTEFLQPYKPRPETSAMAARRLVAGALGLTNNVSREKRERERQQLKEAKEKRRKDRKNREDIWEYGKCAMDEET